MTLDGRFWFFPFRSINGVCAWVCGCLWLSFRRGRNRNESEAEGARRFSPVRAGLQRRARPSLQRSQGWSERQRARGRHHRTDHHQRGARWVSRPARRLALGTENRNRPGTCSGWRRILFLLMVLTTWIGCVIMGGLFNLPEPPSSYLKWKLCRPRELL